MKHENTEREVQLNKPDVVHLVLFGECPNRSLYADVEHENVH